LAKGEKDDEVTFDAEAGRNYFVSMDIRFGLWEGCPQLDLVDDESGRSDVKDCRLVPSR